MDQKPTSRSKARDLATKLYRSTSLEATWVKELIESQWETALGQLAKASDIHDMMRIQGEARGLAKLHDMITSKPLKEE